jgi:hypothetical protein
VLNLIARNLAAIMQGLRPGDPIPVELATVIQAIGTPADVTYVADESWHYYQGDIYTWLKTQHGKLAQQRRSSLYKTVRPFYNPVPEIVDVDADKVFAPKVRGINLSPAIDKRLNALWTRSLFEQLIYRYVKEGAATGTSYLHVLDGKQSRIISHRPGSMHVYRNAQTGQIVLARQSYMVVDPLGLEDDVTPPGEPSWRTDTYTYDFVMTPDWYATFKNQRLWSFSGNPLDIDGRPQARWPNVLGLVPVVEVHHQEDGDCNGVAAWHAYKDTIDRANEIASFMAETMKVHIDPLIVVKGVAKADLEKSIIDGKTTIFYLPFPQNPTDPPPSIELQEWSGRVSDVQGFIDWVSTKLSDALPELQLARIQQQMNPSGLSVALQSSRFVGHIERLRAGYVHGLVQADRIALYAEDVHNNDIQPDPSILADETKYEHSIQTGRVLPADETTDFTNGLSLLNANLIPRTEMLVRFGGYSLPEAEQLLKDADKEAEKRQQQAQERMANSGDNRANADLTNQVLPNGSDPKNPAQTNGAVKAQVQGR